MTQLGILTKAAAQLHSSDVTVLAHVDYGNNDPTGQTFELAVKKALKGGRTQIRGVDVVNTRVGLYDVHQCANILAQFAFAPEHIRPEHGVHLVNVAKIDGAKDGVRKDKIFLAVTTFDEIVVGFTAPGDPILDVVFPHLRAIYDAELPADFLKGKHFRGRDVLPPLLKGVIVQDSSFTEYVRRVPLEEARKHFGIETMDKSRAWFADSFNGPGNERYNIKTAFELSDLMLANLCGANRLNVQIGSEEVGRAVFTDCLQNVPDGELAVSLGSTELHFPDGTKSRLIDIMVKGGNAYKHLGSPSYALPLKITPTGAV